MTAVHLGAGSGQHRRQPYGRGRNVDIYTDRVGGICTVPGNCVSEAEETGCRSGRAGGLIKTIKSDQRSAYV